MAGEWSTQRYLREVAEAGQEVNPLFRSLGVVVERIGEDAATFLLPPGEGIIQGGGVVAGGILSTMADEAMAHAVLSGAQDDQVCVTVDINVRFLAPAPEGVPVRTQARVIRRGGRIAFAEAEVFAGEDTLAAKASASFMVMRHR